MPTNKLPEVWLRGPIDGIPALLQPVAHALLQAKEEVTEIMKEFPDRLLWIKPAGLASVGFHLKHLSGVLDRLFSYAENKQLSEIQWEVLRSEEIATPADSKVLVQHFSEQVDETIEKLKQIKEESLLEHRNVGRSQLPSTVLGLVFHAAEHTMRHVGQLLVTSKVLKENAVVEQKI